jgi:uncharacterized integral membrane protein
MAFPLNLISGQNPGWVFLIELFISWFITPGLPWLIGYVFESRAMSLNPKHQFMAFFPGDLLLGLTSAGLAAYATNVTSAGWYTSVPWAAVVLVGAAVVGWLVRRGENVSKLYPSRAFHSPTKVYHDFVVYVGYGYVLVEMFVTVLFAALSWWLILVAVPAMVWGLLLAVDYKNRFRKAPYAHTANWQPRWQRLHS